MRTSIYLILISFFLLSVYSCSKPDSLEDHLIGEWKIEKIKKNGQLITLSSVNSDLKDFSLYINEDYTCNLIDKEGYTYNYGFWEADEVLRNPRFHDSAYPEEPDIIDAWLLFSWHFVMPELLQGIVLRVDRNDLELREFRNSTEYTYIMRKK